MSVIIIGDVAVARNAEAFVIEGGGNISSDFVNHLYERLATTLRGCAIDKISRSEVKSNVGTSIKRDGSTRGAESVRPLMSVVVVARNLENFIQQALHSVVAQMSPDIEMIYVDNASTDATLRLARATAQGSPHHAIIIIENETNVGLGEGRNLGIARARGRYVLFLDGDDWLAAGALRRLAEVAKLNTPDVLVYNHARFLPDGTQVTYRFLREIPEGWYDSVDERRKILLNLNVAWNKLYRHEFLIDNGLKFGTGYYEDIDWNFQAMLLAKRAFVLPEVLVYYRQRPGSILRSVDPRHFDVFRQWNNVLDFLAKRPDLADAYGESIEKYARGQLSAVLHSDHRVPKDMKPAFFAEMSKLWKRFASELRFRPRDRILDGLIAAGHYRRYLAFLAYVKGKGVLTSRDKRRITKPVRRLRKQLLQHLYKVFLKLPIGERRVLFESYWGKRMDCNPYALFKELSAIGGYECIWVLHDTAEDRSDFPYERVEPGSLRYLFALATSKYLISNANFPTEYDKRPGSVHLQTKHGTPLKVMGLDIRPVRPKEMDWSSFAARCQRWDYVISSNEYSSAVWRRGFPYNYKILETGYPRNDILFNATSDTIAGIRSKLGIAQGMKVALYAPTFRDRDRDAKEQVDFSDALDPKRVLEALGPDYVLLLRAHYLMEATGLQQDPRILDVSTYVDANEVCLISDLLITDYSSIMFDYANLGRPIVLFLHDYDDYMSGRGTYFDIRERAPGPVATTEDALCRALHHRAWESPYNVERLRKFRAEFCSFDDGKASARVLREVFGAGAKVSEKEG